jgi:hypothetical protein
VNHRSVLGPAAARLLDLRLAALPDPDEHTRVLVGELCETHDLGLALGRLRSSMAPGDRVVFLEHVGRPGRLGRLEQAWGDTVARFPWGCHVGRDVVDGFRRAGFHLTDIDRFTLPTVIPVLRSWVRGVAVAREI